MASRQVRCANSDHESRTVSSTPVEMQVLSRASNRVAPASQVTHRCSLGAHLATSYGHVRERCRLFNPEAEAMPRNSLVRNMLRSVSYECHRAHHTRCMRLTARQVVEDKRGSRCQRYRLTRRRPDKVRDTSAGADIQLPLRARQRCPYDDATVLCRNRAGTCEAGRHSCGQNRQLLAPRAAARVVRRSPL